MDKVLIFSLRNFSCEYFIPHYVIIHLNYEELEKQSMLRPAIALARGRTAAVDPLGSVSKEYSRR